MKTIKVNGTDVSVSHEVKTDEKTHHVCIRCKFSHTVSGKSIEHVLTIGAEDEILPVNYNKEQLQKDIEVFKQKHAELFESKIRAADIASQLEE
jgi:hypothetical protein